MTKRPHITAEQINKVIEMYDGGFNNSKIAMILDVGFSTVQRIIRACEAVKNGFEDSEYYKFGTSDLIKKTVSEHYGKPYPSAEPSLAKKETKEEVKEPDKKDNGDVLEKIVKLMSALVMDADYVLKMQRTQFELLDSMAKELGCQSMLETMKITMTNKYTESRMLKTVGTRWLYELNGIEPNV